MEIKFGGIKENGREIYLLRATEVTVDKGKRMIREHRHSRFEIVHFRKGSGIYVVNGKNYSIKQGDVFVFSSNEQHCITEIHQPLEFVNIHFEPKFFWGSSQEGFSSGDIFFNHAKDFCCRLDRKSVEKEKIIILIEGIFEELHCKRAEYKMMARSLLTNIIVILIRNFGYSEAKINSAKNSSSVRAVKKAMDYIYHNLTEQITLDDIAKAVGMSRSHFSTVFKATLGVTLWDYICEKRIELVMRKLEQETDKSMLEIALECGFNNTANFNKAFKKQTGRTPREYKVHGYAYIYE